MEKKIGIVKDEISVEPFTEDFEENVGGIVIFTGVVRGWEEGRRVLKMYVEADEKGALNSFKKIRDDAIKRFKILDLRIYHRVGVMNVGDLIVIISAYSEHRSEAFDACEYAIDALKKESPIWKKVYLEGGEERWIENH